MKTELVRAQQEELLAQVKAKINHGMYPRQLDRATRETLTQNQAHSLGAAPERLYLPRA